MTNLTIKDLLRYITQFSEMAYLLSYCCSCMPVSIVDCPVLEYLSATAVAASFVREANENALPNICYLIPIVAFLPTILVTFKPSLRGYLSFSVLRGLSVGFVGGCSSFIIDLQDATGHPFYTGPGSVGGPFYLRLAFCLETLHVLVLIACLLWTIIHLCKQNSCLGRIPFAVVAAICVEIILLAIAAFQRIHNDFIEGKTLVTVFVIIFLIAMIPWMPCGQRAVILAWLTVFVSFLWQTSKWDKNVWSWRTLRFPVPGGLTAYMLVILSSEPRIPPLDKTSCDNFIAFVAAKIASNVHVSKQAEWEMQVHTVLQRGYRLYNKMISMFGIIFAFVVAFCFFRIMPSLQIQPYYPDDTWLSCLFVILCAASLASSHLDHLFTSSTLILSALCQVLFYVTWTFSSRYPINCYAVDTLLGIILLSATRKAMVHNKKVSLDCYEDTAYQLT